MDLNNFISKLFLIIFVCNLGKSYCLASVFSLKIRFQPELTWFAGSSAFEKNVSLLMALISDVYLLGAIDFQGTTLVHSVPWKNGPVLNSFISIQINNAYGLVSNVLI